MGTSEYKATKLDFRCSLCHWLLLSLKTMWTSIYFFKGLSVAILHWMCSFYSVPITAKFGLSLKRGTGNRGMGMGNGERGTGNL